MSDPPSKADVVKLIRQAIGRTAPNLTNGLDPRLIAAEAVCACALHLVMQWGAWEALNRTALTAAGQDAQEAAMAALTAYELLDQAVHMWAPESHPAVGIALRSVAGTPEDGPL